MAQERPDDNQKPRRSRRTFLIVGAIVLLIAIGVFIYWLIGRGWMSTDDAQIQGHLVPISPRVSGHVLKIYVDDNQHVEAGDPLVDLDPRDLAAQLRKNEADLALQIAQERAAVTQVGVTSRTSVAGSQQTAAQASAAYQDVAVSQGQIASAQAQYASAEANARAALDAVAGARSDVQTARAQISSAQAALRVSQSNVVAAQAQATRAASDAERYRILYARGATSAQELQAMQTAAVGAQSALSAARDQVTTSEEALAQARSKELASQAALRQSMARAASAADAARQALAAVQTAQKASLVARARYQAALAVSTGASTAPQQISISKSQAQAAAAKTRQSSANVFASRLQLSYTRIIAPVNGTVSQKSVEPGQFVQPGQMLMAVIPLRNTWVVANFKETQIGNMKKGQRAIITIDAYPGRRFYGKIDSIGPATGARFSLLPEENATGNFVKVVERIPVKIVLDSHHNGNVIFRPGMNVVARVYTLE